MSAFITLPFDLATMRCRFRHSYHAFTLRQGTYAAAVRLSNHGPRNGSSGSSTSANFTTAP